MPFIGRDWRSPGEAWVKTESLGWQRMKMIESHLHPGCHQHHNLACSWPPPSHVGQHMAINCDSATESSGHTIASNKSSAKETRAAIMNETTTRDELTSNGGSACESDSSSASVSPVSSPAKNSAHHLHPITISSPYGRYSCCGHSPNQTAAASGGSAPICCCDEMRERKSAQQMPRSLSRDSFAMSPSAASSTSCSNGSQRMRYNNSFSDIGSTNDSRQTSIVVIDNHHQEPDDSDLIANESTTTLSPSADNNRSINLSDYQNNLNHHHVKSINGPKRSATGQSTCYSSTARDSFTKVDTGLKSRSASPDFQCCCCNQQQPQQLNQKSYQLNFQEQQKTAPHCRVSVRTREVAMYNTISEAFYRLDFYNAIHDIRRFNYICKLLHLLITQNLTSLSGCATKVLFTMLEQVAWEVSSNKRNIHVIRNLLDELNETIQKYYCWGRPIGSSVLWQQHFDTIVRISRIVDAIEISQHTTHDDNQITLDKLPIEMIREILLRLNDYRDLVSSAQASPVMRNMIDERYIWQKLCRYHFTDQQLKLVFENSSYMNRVKKSTLRGIKYARTVSADGKVSYRNPVARKRVAARSLTKNDRRDCDYQQQDGTQSSSDSDSSPSESTSYVFNTIRIFDKEGASATLSSSKNRSQTAHGRRGSSLSNAKSQITEHQTQAQSSANCRPSCGSKPTDLSDTNHPSTDIDWELVFHHLRKKFDLKEEYADCLLLCRHCRCLFWKSIGHPCIKSDDERSQAKETGRDAARANSAAADDQANTSSRVANRPSVALLSRTFDSRIRADGAENAPPRACARNADSTAARSSLGQQRAGGNAARLPPAPGRHLQELNQRNLRAPESGHAQSARSTDRKELLPKHITITPQAFLKFFSL